VTTFDNRPLVRCDACGREMVATTAQPFEMRMGVERMRYYYVRPHVYNGQRCKGFHSRPVAERVG